MNKIILSAVSLAFSAVFAGCGVIDAVMTTDYDEPEQFTPFEQRKYEQGFVYEDVADWYPQLCDDMRSGDLEPVIQQRVKSSDLKTAFMLHRVYCPEVFWINGYTMHSKGGEVWLELSLLDGMTEDKVIPMYEELAAAAQEITDSIPAGYSDYDKVLYVHDYIAKHCVYDSNTVHEDVQGLWWTAYGCLVQGKAVCSGYAAGFQYIMNLLGIECGTVSGYSYRGTSHAWNYVVIDGKANWIDVTWDDSEYSSTDHSYFMFDDEMMYRTRWIDAAATVVPECDTLDNNYFVRLGAYFEEYDFDAVQSYVSGISGDCEIMFADYETYKTALDDLIGKRKMSRLRDDSFTYYRDDRMFVIKLSE